jgi:hypothetical protein
MSWKVCTAQNVNRITAAARCYSPVLLTHRRVGVSNPPPGKTVAWSSRGATRAQERTAVTQSHILCHNDAIRSVARRLAEVDTVVICAGQAPEQYLAAALARSAGCVRCYRWGAPRIRQLTVSGVPPPRSSQWWSPPFPRSLRNMMQSISNRRGKWPKLFGTSALSSKPRAR